MEQAANNNPQENDDPQVKIFQVVNRVFDLDLLLDMILGYIIHDKEKVTKRRGKSPVTTDVQHCRLVNKRWLRSISRVFQKSEHPLFTFRLCEEYYGLGAVVDRLYSGRRIGPFVRSVKENLHLDERVPPFAITTRHQVFRESDYPVFFNCLNISGSGLCRLDLGMSEQQPILPPNNNFFLPRLQSFSVQLHNMSSYLQKGQIGKSMEDKVNFIQSILDASKQLKVFVIECYIANCYQEIPDCFVNLQLPSSLTILYLDCALNDCKMHSLANNSLPNLKTLRFLVGDSPIQEGLINSILQKVQKTLQNLYVKYGCHMQKIGCATTFQLPLMEKLSLLDFDTALFALKGHCSSLQQRVPMLNQVALCWQTRSMIRKWTDNSCFPFVTCLKVSMTTDDCDPERFCANYHFHVNVDLSSMQALHMAFPNLKTLDITQFNPSDMTALAFIIREMRNLQCLRYRIQNLRNPVPSLDAWDAVILGIPQESVAALRESPHLWDGLQVENDDSIRNLIDLQTLELECNNCVFSISVMAFHCAFFKMPQLSTLILKGFRTTTEMASRWRSEGRSIERD